MEYKFGEHNDNHMGFWLKKDNVEIYLFTSELKKAGTIACKILSNGYTYDDMVEFFEYFNLTFTQNNAIYCLEPKLNNPSPLKKSNINGYKLFLSFSDRDALINLFFEQVYLRSLY